MHRFVSFGAFVLLVFALAPGCAPQTPQQRLTGRWIGAPSVTGAVDDVVDNAAQGQEVNPLARGAAQFVGKLVARQAMAVELDLRASGAAFFRGHTEAIAMPEDSDGTWEVLSANPDVMEVSFEAENHRIEGKIIFRSDDEFTLKLPPMPVAAAGAADAPAGSKPAETADGFPAKAKAPSPPQPTSIVFKRSS